MKPTRKRTLILLAVGLVASALVLAAAVQGPLRTGFQRELKPGTLPYLAKELKANGITKHTLPVPWHHDFGVPANGFDQMLDGSRAVVVATLLDKRYRMSADLERIETVAKYRVDDFLSGTIKRAKGQVSAERMPAGARTLAPVEENEILVLHSGGTLGLKGVLFHQADYTTGFPPFKVGQQYVLFLGSFEPKEGDTQYGGRSVRLYSVQPDGAYVVSQEGLEGTQIQAHGPPPPEVLGRELRERFLSQRVHFVEHLRRRGRQPQIEWLEEK